MERGGFRLEAIEAPEGAVAPWLTLREDLGRVMAGLAVEGSHDQMMAMDTGSHTSGGGGKQAGGRRRGELVETAVDKTKFKEFFKVFKQREKESYAAAAEFAQSCLVSHPRSIHWRICLELADLAKRQDMLQEARHLFEMVHELEPLAHQGWLEHAKMEEEFGKLVQCERILLQGLQHCSENENLLLKSVKLEEKLGSTGRARVLLSRMRHLSLDKAWKVILEGALLEARAGNIQVARKVFRYLLQSVPWYGPIYHEAYRMEERAEAYARAADVIDLGLREIPRYGPLWFNALRLADKMAPDPAESARAVRDVVQRALGFISKELVWKLFFEAAQTEDRAGNLESCRAAYVQSVLHCPQNLRWKVWIGGARTELRAGNVATARGLLERALVDVPRKTRSMVLLEVARVDEFTGNVEDARLMLQRARRETRSEWKVFLESVLLEMRANDVVQGVLRAREALNLHTGTGRLWAVLIQLVVSDHDKLQVFLQALKEVPKSGEVWCEGARLMLNPMSPMFHLGLARRRLEFAICFTPQYGDSFIEMLRLELLEHGPDADTAPLEQLCVNADPNYGALWFYSKRHPLDGTRQILQNAKELLLRDLHQHRRLYQRALVRLQSGTGSPSSDSSLDDEGSDASPHSLPHAPPPPGAQPGGAAGGGAGGGGGEGPATPRGPSSTQPVHTPPPPPPSSPPPLSPGSVSASHFGMGITELQHYVQNCAKLGPQMRLKLIFGPDPVQP